MPEVFADQQTCAPKAGIKRPDLVPPGEETTFIKQTISGQIHFVMDM